LKCIAVLNGQPCLLAAPAAPAAPSSVLLLAGGHQSSNLKDNAAILHHLESEASATTWCIDQHHKAITTQNVLISALEHVSAGKSTFGCMH
jgi:hypothetical protein